MKKAKGQDLNDLIAEGDRIARIRITQALFYNILIYLSAFVFNIFDTCVFCSIAL